MASAVSDGGGSLEATHQGDTIAPVFARWCLYGRVSPHVTKRKRAMLSYMSLLQPTHGGSELVNLPSHTHARTRWAIRGGKGTWFCSTF